MILIIFYMLQLLPVQKNVLYLIMDTCWVVFIARDIINVIPQSIRHLWHVTCLDCYQIKKRKRFHQGAGLMYSPIIRAITNA